MDVTGRAQLEALVEEATVDCNGEDEQVIGLYTMIVDKFASPFQTTVLGVEVTVEDIDLTNRGTIVAHCSHGAFRQAIDILDLPCRRHRPTAPNGSRRTGTGTADMGAPKPLPPRPQAWVDARKRHRLSHAQVQMARELGLNPAKLGQLDNHRQELWKAPLPQFIEDLYAKRFGRERPDVINTIEEIARPAERHRAERAAHRASHTRPA